MFNNRINWSKYCSSSSKRKHVVFIIECCQKRKWRREQHVIDVNQLRVWERRSNVQKYATKSYEKQNIGIRW